MSAYVVAMVNVTDPEKYAKYSAKASIACDKFGGEFIVRGGNPEVVEGNVPYGRIVVIRFEAREQAHAFYDSMQYQDARQERLGAADFNLAIVDGV